ncbi:shufflon system plasmid conjugative transfer pilus tip adhesin PilV [Klebsiella pneumoniae]|uniref:shufflon system plasmid conjugative transfer pilus tip adhesin PilV n=1 Tax=Klebsiella pneumoniae TaxID=573 RepID=UPI00133113B8|nr:shufflon system plasmid conjugative transfer pilus tip adhesin PilV [Klebsiella pneumoniae]
MGFIKKNNGFSLLELILVLGIGTSMGLLKFQEMKSTQEDITASLAGEQLKQIGQAVNSYITMKYDKLSTLSNSSNDGNDPGPRICNSTQCEITYSTLLNEGLLPASYTGINIYKSPYKIILKRDGVSPNYIINGLITTTIPWMDGSKIRYDLLGKAMQTAGIDSGMTDNSTVVSGLQGQWKESATNFSNINKSGLLAMRVGFNSALYTIYLRRDGTLPMTGDLSLGGYDINNIKNLSTSGTGNFQGALKSGDSITAGKELIAHNGNNDVIAIGGNDGNDYEIRLYNGTKPLTIYSPNAANYTTVLQVNKNAIVEQRLGLMGYDPNDLPAGWGGGLRTLDVYAAGTVAAGNSGITNAYLNSSGNIYASNNVDVGNQINTRYVWASGNLNSNYIHSNGNIDADGSMNIGWDVNVNKRITTNEYIQINGTATAGGGCSPNGLQGRDSMGLLLSCVSGKWAKTSGAEGFFTKNQGSCLIKHPDTNACTCPSGTAAYELFYTTSTEQLGTGSGTRVVKDSILYQCR